jgi:hypothetical protein
VNHPINKLTSSALSQTHARSIHKPRHSITYNTIFFCILILKEAIQRESGRHNITMNMNRRTSKQNASLQTHWPGWLQKIRKFNDRSTHWQSLQLYCSSKSQGVQVSSRKTPFQERLVDRACLEAFQRRRWPLLLPRLSPPLPHYHGTPSTDPIFSEVFFVFCFSTPAFPPCVGDRWACVVHGLGNPLITGSLFSSVCTSWTFFLFRARVSYSFGCVYSCNSCAFGTRTIHSHVLSPLGGWRMPRASYQCFLFLPLLRSKRSLNGTM